MNREVVDFPAREATAGSASLLSVYGPETVQSQADEAGQPTRAGRQPLKCLHAGHLASAQGDCEMDTAADQALQARRWPPMGLDITPHARTSKRVIMRLNP